MTDPKLPSAKRRLNALLRDEEYGPKLARLNRTDERRVLDLIYENRGREARQAIDDLDSRRRRQRTLRDKARDYANLPRRRRRETLPAVKSDIVGGERLFWKQYDRMSKS